MDQQLHVLTVATPDLDAARHFYSDALGWTPTLDVPGEIIFYQVAHGLLLGLFAAETFDEDLGVPGAHRGVSGLTLAHNVDTPDAVREVVAAMVSGGGEVVTAPGQGRFGGVFHAHVRDPNGIHWEIAHNSGWRIDEDGSVRLG